MTDVRVTIPPKTPIDPTLAAMGIGTEAEVEDANANHELYQQFLREEQARAAETPAGDATGETPSTGGGEEAPDGGGSEAPETTPPGTPPETPETGEPTPDEQVDPSVAPDELEEPVVPESDPEPVTLGARTYTHADLERAVQVDAWAASLPPQVREGIDAFLAGTHVLIPREQAAQPPSAGGLQAPASETPPPNEDDDLLDPAVKARFDRMERMLSQQQQTVAQQQAQDQEVQRQQIEAQLLSGALAFQQAHSLTDEDLSLIQGQVVALQTLPGYAAQHAGNYSAAMQAAMEAAYWTNPTFREREVQAQLEAETATAVTHNTRKTKASAITGTGGSVPRTQPKPMTQQDRQKAMAAEIGAAMSGGQSE